MDGQWIMVASAIITALGVVCSLFWRVIQLVSRLVEQHKVLMVQMVRVLDRIEDLERWRARRERARG